MAQATGATNHGNRYAVVDSNYDIKVVVDLFLQEKPFEEHPGRSSGDTRETKHADLFSNGSAKIALGIPLKNYKSRAQGNWVQNEPARHTTDGLDGQSIELFDNDVDDIIEHRTRISDKEEDD